MRPSATSYACVDLPTFLLSCPVFLQEIAETLDLVNQNEHDLDELGIFFLQISSLVLIILPLKQISDIEGNEKQPYYICCLSFSIYNIRQHEILPIPQMMPIQSKVCFEHPEAMQQ